MLNVYFINYFLVNKKFMHIFQINTFIMHLLIKNRLKKIRMLSHDLLLIHKLH